MRSIDEINEKVLEMQRISDQIQEHGKLAGRVPFHGTMAQIEALSVILALAWVLEVTPELGMSYVIDKNGILRLRSEVMEDGKL